MPVLFSSGPHLPPQKGFLRLLVAVFGLGIFGAVLVVLLNNTTTDANSPSNLGSILTSSPALIETLTVQTQAILPLSPNSTPIPATPTPEIQKQSPTPALPKNTPVKAAIQASPTPLPPKSTVTPLPPKESPTPNGNKLATVLYDGAKENSLPGSQGFTYLTNPLAVAAATQNFDPATGITTLDSTPVKSNSAGYFARANLLPVLNRTAGYSIQFKVQVVSENHAGSDRNGDGVADRAGFSLIVLSSDLRGIELGFWTDQIWAQQDGKALFTHAEGAKFNTKSELISYSLNITGDNYALSGNGKPILSGKLRDYSRFGWPYSTPNFLFLGDDTSSASALIRLAAVSVTVNQ